MKNKEFYVDKRTTIAIMFIGLIGLNYTISFIISLFPFYSPDDPVIFYAVSSSFSILAIIICWMLYSKSTYNKLFYPAGIKKFNPIYIAIAVLAVGGMFFGLGFFNTFIADIIIDLGGKVSTANIPLNNAWQLILFSFCYAVMPAVFEELFFRGIMLDGLKDVKTVYAVLISALCFALYHCSLTQLIYQFVYGIILGYLAIKSKSIIPGVIVHFLNNFTILLLNYLNIVINLFNPLIIAGGMVILAISIIALIFYKKTKIENNAESLKPFFIPYGIVVIFLCLMISVLSAVGL